MMYYFTGSTAEIAISVSQVLYLIVVVANIHHTAGN